MTTGFHKEVRALRLWCYGCVAGIFFLTAGLLHSFFSYIDYQKELSKNQVDNWYNLREEIIKANSDREKRLAAIENQIMPSCFKHVQTKSKKQTTLR